MSDKGIENGSEKWNIQGESTMVLPYLVAELKDTSVQERKHRVIRVAQRKAVEWG